MSSYPELTPIKFKVPFPPATKWRFYTFLHSFSFKPAKKLIFIIDILLLSEQY
jgi:hypothetical protein